MYVLVVRTYVLRTEYRDNKESRLANSFHLHPPFIYHLETKD